MGGSLGNDIFVLISGYFLIESKGIKFRRLFNLWLRIFLYSVIIFCLFVFSGLVDFSRETALKCLFPITREHWWFASTYFVLYIIHPYLNILLHSLNREDYKKFLMTIFFCWSIVATFTASHFAGNALINFMCIYALAGYVKLWANDFGNKKYVLYSILFIFINFASVIFLDVIGQKFSFVGDNATYFCGMMRPFTLMASFCFFISFKHLDVKYNKVINVIASATFGVYLLHENAFSKYFLWHIIFKIPSFQNSPYLIPYSIAAILLVYVSCTLIELLRSKIFKYLSHGNLS